MMTTTMLDSRGRESTTLFFVTVAFWSVTVKFWLSSFAFADGKISFLSGFAGSGEYGASVVLILGIWLGREWRVKKADEAAEVARHTPAQ